MPTSKLDNYMLTVLDYFSKWPEVVAIQDKRAETVTGSLYKIFMRLRFPAVCSSDQDREFVNSTLQSLLAKIVAAFQGMHVSPAKHTFGKCDGRTDRRTDDGESDPYVLLCFAGDTKTKSAHRISSFYHPQTNRLTD